MKVFRIFILLIFASLNMQAQSFSEFYGVWLGPDNSEIKFELNSVSTNWPNSVVDYRLSYDTLILINNFSGGVQWTYDENGLKSTDTILQINMESRYLIEQLTNDSLKLFALDSLAISTTGQLINRYIHGGDEYVRLALYKPHVLYEIVKYDSAKVEFENEGHFAKYNKDLVVYYSGKYECEKRVKEYRIKETKKTNCANLFSKRQIRKVKQLFNESGINQFNGNSIDFSATHSTKYLLTIFYQGKSKSIRGYLFNVHETAKPLLLMLNKLPCDCKQKSHEQKVRGFN